MTIEDVQPIIDEGMSDNFDSHDFIRELLQRSHNLYEEMVEKYGSVASAHGMISIFLLNHASALGIEKNGDRKNKSKNINGIITPCAKWRKIR